MIGFYLIFVSLLWEFDWVPSQQTRWPSWHIINDNGYVIWERKKIRFGCTLTINWLRTAVQALETATKQTQNLGKIFTKMKQFRACLEASWKLHKMFYMNSIDVLFLFCMFLSLLMEFIHMTNISSSIKLIVLISQETYTTSRIIKRQAQMSSLLICWKWVSMWFVIDYASLFLNHSRVEFSRKHSKLLKLFQYQYLGENKLQDENKLQFPANFSKELSVNSGLFSCQGMFCSKLVILSSVSKYVPFKQQLM